MEFWKDDRIAQIATKEGKIPFKIPSIDKPCFTWYRTFGDLSQGPPLVVLHGTSASHGYMLSLADLWLTHGIPLVFYDQIGCGLTTRLPETKGDFSFWQPSLFIAELDNLLDHLQLRDGPGYHILGHSWGGMWGGQFAATRPRGLQRLVLASPSASQDLYYRAYSDHTRQLLPPDARDAIDRAMQTHDVHSKDYKNAMVAFRTKFTFGMWPPLPVLQAAGQAMSEDPTVSQTLYDSLPFCRGGSLEHWTSIPLLPQITAPTLLYNAEYDICHDICLEPYFQHIPRVRQVQFTGASHMTHLQKREEVVKLVGDFLTSDPNRTKLWGDIQTNGDADVPSTKT